MGTSHSLLSKSIFAAELARLLENRGRALGDLARTPINLDRKKVVALEASLHDLRRLPALNHAEIMSVVFLLKLSPEEQLAIYAALIALGVQRLILTYLSPERTYQIADEIRQAAFSWLKRQHELGKNPFRRIPPGGETTQEMIGEGEEQFLAALASFDEGTALAALGQASIDGESEVTLLQQAQLCYEQALARLGQMPKHVQATEEWRYWDEKAQESLRSTQEELE